MRTLLVLCSHTHSNNDNNHTNTTGQNGGGGGIPTKSNKAHACINPPRKQKNKQEWDLCCKIVQLKIKAVYIVLRDDLKALVVFTFLL